MMRKMILTAAAILVAGGALAQETEISGFADASYVYDTAEANGEFGLDQVEIDVVRRTGEKTVVRADFEWVKNGEAFDAQVEQAFMTYSCDGGWDFTFGKFNAPMGFELLDPVDMFQFSHALVFDHGLPTNLTGAAAARDLGRGFDIVAHVSNGWDRNSSAGGNATWGGRVGFASAGFSGGLSAISGKEREDVDGAEGDAFTRTVFDVDLSYAGGAWTLGGEFNRGDVTVEAPGGDIDREWTGLLLMAHYDHTDRLGLTVRYDWFDDPDGWAFGDIDGEFQTIQAIAVCPTFALADNLGALLELRVEKSDRDAYADRDGDPADTSTVIAFEMTGTW